MQHGPRNAVRRIVAGAADRLAQRLDRAADQRVDALRQEVAELRGEVIRQADRVVDRVVEFEVRSRRDIVYAGDQQAGRESSDFALEHFLDAKQFKGANETLRYAVSQARSGGMALEFGVASGATLGVIAEERKIGEIYGFDSFQGLPQAWLVGVPVGAFIQDQLPDVAGAELVVGLFEDTLPQFLAEHTGPVDFVHVDSDLYTSARTVLGLVGPRLQPGSIVHFDEFYNYPGWQQHELRAWNEYVADSGVEFDYIAHAHSDCQVTVRITATPSADSSRTTDVQ
jgi:hypothetical protein